MRGVRPDSSFVKWTDDLKIFSWVTKYYIFQKSQYQPILRKFSKKIKKKKF